MGCSDSIRSKGDLQLAGQITPVLTVDYCDCSCVGQYYETVFAKDGGDEHENDCSSFLFKTISATDTVVITLYKDGVSLGEITDDTYGTLYDFGAWTDVTEQSRYKGFVIDWEKVIIEEGSGEYYLEAVSTILGTASTFTSHKFRLRYYTDQRADGTVRVTTYQNGNIIGSDFNYTGMNWQQCIRIRGEVLKKREFTKDTYLDSDWNESQIQDQVTWVFDMTVDGIPESISKVLFDDNILANDIYLNDYNIFNHNIIRNQAVYPSEIGEPTHYAGNVKSDFEATFKEKKQDRIKRNYD